MAFLFYFFRKKSAARFIFVAHFNFWGQRSITSSLLLILAIRSSGVSVLVDPVVLEIELAFQHFSKLSFESQSLLQLLG